MIRVPGLYTEPQKTPVPLLIKGDVRILSPAEARFLLANVWPNSFLGYCLPDILVYAPVRFTTGTSRHSNRK